MPAGIKASAKSILGDIKKAMLIIPKKNEEIDQSKIAGKTAAAMNAASALGSAQEKTARTSLEAAGFYILPVQYNPSSLSVQANASSIPVQYLQQNIDNGIPNQNFRPPSVVLTVDLVFDAMNIYDAFMFEKANITPNNALRFGKAIAQSKMTREGFSVQPQTNALLACLMRQSTRSVIFQWADMTFAGDVTEVSASYKMFSVSGKPIRSFVKMNITQKVNGEANHSYWNKAFDNCFGDMLSTGEAGGKSMLEKTGNLLNIT